MTQHYIGAKRVQAYPLLKNGEPGYGVIYEDGYQSWSPKAAFEKAYLPLGDRYAPPGVAKSPNSNTVTQAMVDNFIRQVQVSTLGEKTTVVQATLANGFELVESSACVDPVNYSEEVGAEICLERIKSKVWQLLGFALQWAVSGVGRK